MRGNQGYRRADRLPAAPLLGWLESERPWLALTATDQSAVRRARRNGFVDLYVADRVCCALGAPEMLRLLYPTTAELVVA